MGRHTRQPGKHRAQSESRERIKGGGKPGKRSLPEFATGGNVDPIRLRNSEQRGHRPKHARD